MKQDSQRSDSLFSRSRQAEGQIFTTITGRTPPFSPI